MRLIDADAIPEKEMNYPAWVCLKKQPTIDAVPVVHGRWMPVDAFGEDPYSCSECGNGVNVYGYIFCPNCGMPMTDEAIEILKKRMDGADNE